MDNNWNYGKRWSNLYMHQARARALHLAFQLTLNLQLSKVSL